MVEQEWKGSKLTGLERAVPNIHHLGGEWGENLMGWNWTRSKGWFNLWGSVYMLDWLRLTLFLLYGPRFHVKGCVGSIWEMADKVLRVPWRVVGTGNLENSAAAKRRPAGQHWFNFYVELPGAALPKLASFIRIIIMWGSHESRGGIPDTT